MVESAAARPSLEPLATIHLDRSRTPRAFDLEESLWENELEHMFELVLRHLQALHEMRDQPVDRQPRLSIAIFGTYGSGKTSLLKTFARLANGGELVAKLERKELSLLDDRIYALPEIQPNLMAKDDHFLYAFLAAALEEDLHPRAPKRLHGPSGRGPGLRADGEDWRLEQRPETAQFLSPVQRAFQEVSEYLQVVDESHGAEEYDPLGLSLERLERHTSGLRLKESLADLIVQLAERLAGPAPSLLLLPVDDADMAQENLVETLDSYRRYLMHPRLVPVFTFTDRLADELLQVHFARKLSLAESAEISKGRNETSGVASLTQNLGFQYLAKLFPVRNRVRLGPAASRVQASEFKTADGACGLAVDLLRAASVLLFGCSAWPVVPEVRAALRPSTLRRQIQVVDAMFESRIEELRGSLPGGGAPSPVPVGRWVQAFDDSCWAVLNAHRDALAEFDLHVEDLQSWSPLGLRRALLGTLLSRPLAQRRQLLKSWRYRSEDRRSQLLSLVALNAFRPRMPGEEPGGDDPREWWVFQREAEGFPPPRELLGIDAMLGVIWFLEIWIGFYLPQILARHGTTTLGEGSELPKSAVSERGPALSRSMIAAGWGLGSGPSHAVREFLDLLRKGQSSGTGMLLLRAEGFEELLRNVSTEAEGTKGKEKKTADSLENLTLLLHLWCFYGDSGKGGWAALSLWKGLGLMGALLQEYLFCQGQGRGGEDCFRERADRLVVNACRAAREPGVRGSGTASSFMRWDPEEERSRESTKVETHGVSKLVKELEAWLQRYAGRRIHPTSPAITREDKPEEEDWKGCFIRRLHGDQILGELWRDLGTAYLEPPGEEDQAPIWSALRFAPDGGGTDAECESWNASTAIEKWMAVIERYFDWTPLWMPDGGRVTVEGESRLGDFFRDCPLVKRWKSLEGEIGAFELLEKVREAKEGKGEEVPEDGS